MSLKECRNPLIPSEPFHIEPDVRDTPTPNTYVFKGIFGNTGVPMVNTSVCSRGSP